MRTKSIVALVALFALAFAGEAWAYTAGNAKTGCCFPGSECCYSGSPCCPASERAAECRDGSCCPDGPCCPSGCCASAKE
jgi:hypothetical protein